LNYRHGFHAGNFADVVKHAVLARALVALKRKDAPFRYIDTHAGAGRYSLTDPMAERSPEWRDGIARLLRAPRSLDIQGLLAPYLATIGEPDADGGIANYPGSPAIAQRLLRRQDVLALCERNPEEALALRGHLGRDSRVRISTADGYVALNAYVPPKERRGLVLIDPPFEAETERERLTDAARNAVRKWPQGCYLIWRPIKDRAEDRRLLAQFADFGRPDLLNIEIDVGRAPGLRRAGLLIINSPFGLFEEARALLAYLTPLLARGDGADFVCERLTPPT